MKGRLVCGCSFWSRLWVWFKVFLILSEFLSCSGMMIGFKKYLIILVVVVWWCSEKGVVKRVEVLERDCSCSV